MAHPDYHILWLYKSQRKRRKKREREGNLEEKKKNWEEHTKKKKDSREQIFCPCFFSRKQRRSCLAIVRHEHLNNGHPLGL
jgi:hypothetical protein